MYTKAFPLCLIKTWERTWRKRDGETGKYKLNEMGALNIVVEKVRQTR